MAKIPYGFDANLEGKDDSPWTRLATINEHLEDNEAVPPYIACWLGSAIKYSHRNPEKFLTLLGLMAPQGRKRITPDSMMWAARVVALEDDGMKKEKAISTVLGQMDIEMDNAPSPNTLRKWRKEYLELLKTE